MSDIDSIPAAWIVMAKDGQGREYPIASRLTESEAWTAAAGESAKRRTHGYPRVMWPVWVMPTEEHVEVKPSCQP